MKRWSKVMLAVGLVALLAVMLLACDGGGGGGFGGGGSSAASTPEQTVRNLLSAMQSLDVERMAACCMGEALQEVRDWDIPEGTRISISNISIRVVSESATEAQIAAEYDVSVTIPGEGIIEAREFQTYHLMNVGGSWYIDEVS